MADENPEVLNLFPNRVAVFTVTEDLSNLEKVKDFLFESIHHNGENFNLYKTFPMDLLKSFPEEENLIIRYFNEFKNDVLGLNDIDFYVEKSWSIRADEQGYSPYHNHSDAYYSGVLYFDNIPEGGELEFITDGTRPFKFKTYPFLSTNSIFKAEKFTFKARKNILIFFPAYLKHSIKPNLGKHPRYSIAFNILPKTEI